jgi:deoxyribodipyrimidine photo-lyase
VNDVTRDAGRDDTSGYPIADAGVRQLRGAGWMHNQVQMVVAGFLA